MPFLDDRITLKQSGNSVFLSSSVGNLSHKTGIMVISGFLKAQPCAYSIRLYFNVSSKGASIMNVFAFSISFTASHTALYISSQTASGCLLIQLFQARACFVTTVFAHGNDSLAWATQISSEDTKSVLTPLLPAIAASI